MLSAKPLTILGITFQAPNAFIEGHILSASEARALNSLFHKDLAASMKGLIEKKRNGGELDENAISELQLEFTYLTKTHEFGSARSANSFDLVQREAFKILRPLITKKLRDKNIDMKTLPDGKLEERMLQALAKRPDILEEAKRRANATKALAQTAIGLDA